MPQLRLGGQPVASFAARRIYLGATLIAGRLANPVRVHSVRWLAQGEPSESSAAGLIVTHSHTTAMLYENPGGNPIDWDKYNDDDVRSAFDGGIDAFAVNLFGLAQVNGTLGAKLAAAARVRPDFRAFLSADLAGTSGFGGANGAQEIRDAVKNWQTHPNYLKIDGRPVLTTYDANKHNAAWWKSNVLDPLKAEGINVYFVPDMHLPVWPGPASITYENTRSNVVDPWASVADAYTYFFVPGSVPFYDQENLGHHWWSQLAVQELLGQAARDVGRTTMSSVHPHAWWVCRSAHQFHVFQGGRGLENQWMSIINIQKPGLVILNTWNDYSESTHFQPKFHGPSLNQAWRPFATHIGQYEFARYFHRWYRTGVQPSITRDVVFYFYREHPIGVTGAGCQTPLNQRWGNVQDVIYVTTALTAPATVRVTIGGGTPQTFQVGAGIVHTDVSFSGGTGTPLFEIVRGGRVITTSTGSVAITNSPERTNYHENSGYAMVGGIVSQDWVPGTAHDWF